ncbi:MAG TPA: hypothetical protein VNB92_04235 [Rubrobacter sp.]|nr:hypothetical protein [Rubrobacter sp.]
MKQVIKSATRTAILSRILCVQEHHDRPFRVPAALVAPVGTTLTDNTPRIRFSATVGEEPEVEISFV